MISILEFLFPANVPDLHAPECLRMIREIGAQSRWAERTSLIAALVLLVPVVLLGTMGLRDLIRGEKPTLLIIAAPWLVMSVAAFLLARSLGQPLRPYRLAAAEYANYTVVEARVVKLGMVVRTRPSQNRYRKVKWESAGPLARTGWTPRLLVSSTRLFSENVTVPEVRVGDVAYVGLDPSGRLPPLFLGLRPAAR